MRKQLRTLISLSLAALMFIVPAFGDMGGYCSEQRYVSLGDSIAGGIGLPDNPLRGPDQPDKNKVFCYKTPGAYPVLVAEALGIKDENFAQLACAGMRTVELRACLDPSYTVPDSLANNFTGNELKEWVMDRYDYREYVKNADIITMNMCANDIAAYALFYARGAMNKGGVPDAAINTAIGECGYSTALMKLLELSQTLGNYAEVAKAAITGLYVGYNRWMENWDAIIGIIYDLNPDVKLICVGMNNPFNHLKVSKNSRLEIGAAADGLVTSINYWSSTGSKYSDRYIYVDIMGIETICEEQGNTLTDAGFLNSFELNVHPSMKGQKQIADKIIDRITVQNDGFCNLFMMQFKRITRMFVNKFGMELNQIIGSFVC